VPTEEWRAQADILRDLFESVWRPRPVRRFPPHVAALARACRDGDASAWAILGDALDDEGEEEAAAHARRSDHVRGCWLLDWVLAVQ
jgi:hypothetical protein